MGPGAAILSRAVNKETSFAVTTRRAQEPGVKAFGRALLCQKKEPAGEHQRHSVGAKSGPRSRSLLQLPPRRFKISSVRALRRHWLSCARELLLTRQHQRRAQGSRIILTSRSILARSGSGGGPEQKYPSVLRRVPVGRTNTRSSSTRSDCRRCAEERPRRRTGYPHDSPRRT